MWAMLWLGNHQQVTLVAMREGKASDRGHFALAREGVHLFTEGWHCKCNGFMALRNLNLDFASVKHV